jgi:hypothetical protein
MRRFSLTALASNWMKVSAALASVLVLAVLAAGCGGGGGGSSDTMSAQDWADGVCSAISTWTDSIKSAGQSLTGGNLSKDSLGSTATDVKDSTAQLKDDLQGLGKPDTESGDEAKQSIDELSSNIQEDVDQMDSAIKDVQNGGSIMTAVTTVTGSLSTMSTQVQSTFNDLENLDPKGELESAFKNASSCKSLTSKQS